MQKAIPQPMPLPPDLILQRTCWILAAGASHGCVRAPGRTCCPLTRELIRPEELDPALRDYVAGLIGQGLLPGPNVGDALGPHLESTIDVLRGLCSADDGRAADAAAGCLRDLVRL